MVKGKGSLGLTAFCNGEDQLMKSLRVISNLHPFTL